MFDELSPQDFAFKARDVLLKNSRYTGLKRYNADYHSMQRIRLYLRDHLTDCKEHRQASRAIQRALLLLTPHNENNEKQMRSLLDACFRMFDSLVRVYVESSLEELDVAVRMSSSLLKVLNKHQNRIFNSSNNNSGSTNKTGESMGHQRSSATTEANDDDADYNYHSIINSKNNSNNRGGNGSVAAVDDDDSEEEEEEEFDSNEYAVPVAQMSLQLRQALGLENIGEEDDRIQRMANSSNWIAPAKHGLGNSAALFSIADYDAPWKNTHNSPRRYQQQRVAATPAAYENEYADEANSDDEEEEEEEDDEDGDHGIDDDHIPTGAMSLGLMKALGLDTSGMEEVSTDWKPPEHTGLQHSKPIIVPKARVDSHNSINSDDDDGDDDYEYDGNEYEIPVAQMSMSLRRALGLVTAAEEAAEAAQQHSGGSNSNSSSSRWQAPKSHGLSNSAPIISSAANRNYHSPSHARHRHFVEPHSHSTHHNNSTSTSVDIGNAHHSRPHQSKYDIEQEEEEANSDDEEEEEDDEDGDHGIDDDHIPTGAMSLGLMKALGLDTSGMEEVSTDWKPPEHTGLQHSKPIVQTHGNSSSGGGNHKAKSPTHRHRSPSSAARAQELQSRSYSNQSSFPVIGNRTRP